MRICRNSIAKGVREKFFSEMHRTGIEIGGGRVPRTALSPEQKKDYTVTDLPYWFEKEARKQKIYIKDLAKALGITPQAWNGRKKPMVNGKPKDSFSYGDMLILFNLLDVPKDERLKIMTL